ncbi:MAG: hypothetical protein LBP39_00885, partial [Rickettsiales bacterium]|nr:hypothetical protein [Rickettsiales bacterium]
IETLEERWDILLGEISKMTGATLYNPYNSNDNKNIILYSEARYSDLDNFKKLLTEEKKKEFSNSRMYRDEKNFLLFWHIFEKFGKEMFLANRRKLRENGKKLEPRHPTSTPVKYMEEGFDSCKEWLKISSTLQDQNKHSITAEKIGSMVSRSNAITFSRLLDAYEDLKNNRTFYGGGLINSLWKESDNDKGYFEENDISVKSLQKSDGEDKDKIRELAINFIESYMSSEQVRNKLNSVIAEIEDIRKTIEDKDAEGIALRGIPPPTDDGEEKIYESKNGCEGRIYFDHYKKTDVTDKIFDNINELPVGGFAKRFIEEGGTNLTMDSIMSAQFARGANNAFIVTGTAIPVGNLLGTSEMPEILANVSKNADQAKRFAENNPVMPLTNKKPQENIQDSDVLYVTGEYMLDQWKKKQKKGKLENPEDRKKFIEELYNDLKKRVAKYMDNMEKLNKLNGRLEKVKKKYENIINSNKEHSNAQILEKPEIYELDDKKIKHLEEAIYKDTGGQKTNNTAKITEVIQMNEIALKLQKLSLMKNSIAMEDMKKSSRINQTVEKLSPPPAGNFRKNRLARKNSFRVQETDRRKKLEKHGLV